MPESKQKFNKRSQRRSHKRSQRRSHKRSQRRSHKRSQRRSHKRSQQKIIMGGRHRLYLKFAVIKILKKNDGLSKHDVNKIFASISRSLKHMSPNVTIKRVTINPTYKYYQIASGNPNNINRAITNIKRIISIKNRKEKLTKNKRDAINVKLVKITSSMESVKNYIKK